MGENEKPRKKMIFDHELRLHRICWVLESTCPGCGQELENIFNQRPGKIEILEALVFPCDTCTKKMEREYERERKLSRKISKPSANTKCIQLHKKGV